jgi:integrase
MPQFLSEDFMRNKTAKLMAGRAERVFRDSKLTGFLLRVRRGADDGLLPTWLIEQPAWLIEQPARRKKNPRKVIIGDYPTFDARKARELAQAMLQAIKRGDDPVAERAAKRTQPRWEDLVAAFKAKHLPKLKASTASRYNGVIGRVLTPAFAGRRIADITTAQIAAVHARKADKPTDANNALRVLSKMMGFAAGEGLRSGSNPVLGIARYADKVRDRWLDETELPKFLAALATETDACADLIRFLTISGWRVSDARLLDWAQVNLQSGEVRLEDSATKKRAKVISADAAVLIDRQPGRTGAVFSRHSNMPLDYNYLRDRLRALCGKAGIAPITPHTLRHSAATWCALGGGDIVELRDAFGWRTLAMPSRYIKSSRTAAHRGAERVAAAINILNKPSAEIIAAKC